jgi:hypothetical protein
MDWLGLTWVNILISWAGLWDYDYQNKFKSLISNQPNVKGWNWKKNQLKKDQKNNSR